MADTGSERGMMQRPAWKWEWNLNTIVILLGFAGGLIAWGGTQARVSDGLAASRLADEKHERRLTALEAQARILDNHELRIANVEKQASDSAGAMRDVNATLNGLAADMKVTREILQRIEASAARRAPP